MTRDHSKIIWRTVVFAAAMLGTPACGGKKPAATTPDTTATTDATTDAADPVNPCDPCAADPCDPCGDRPRGSDDEEGGMGRGFILS